MEPPPSEPRWRRRPENRPEEIAEAALALFVEHGFAATRLDAVAKAAGVTKGTLYLYFENKEDLFRSAVRGRILPLIERGEAVAGKHEGTAPDLIRQLFRGWATETLSDRAGDVSRLVLAEAGRFPSVAQFFTEEVSKRARQLFADVIERGVATGEFRTVDVEAAARLAIAPVIHFAVHRRSLGAHDDHMEADRYLDAHIDLFVRGLLRVPSDD